MKEFIKWTYKNELIMPLYADSIKWNNNILEIDLSYEKSSNKPIKLIFDDIVYSYKVIDESYAADFWIDSVEKYYPFYYNYNSEELYYFKKKNEHITNDKIIHFAVIAVDCVVEIFTSAFPKIYVN